MVDTCMLGLIIIILSLVFAKILDIKDRIALLESIIIKLATEEYNRKG
jgi:hypothetical protein